MIQRESEKSKWWFILSLVASPIEFVLWLFFYFPVLAVGDIRKIIVVLAHLAFLFYPIWLLVSFFFYILSYRQGRYHRIKLFFVSNILYLFALVVLTILTLLFGLYR